MQVTFRTELLGASAPPSPAGGRGTAAAAARGAASEGRHTPPVGAGAAVAQQPEGTPGELQGCWVGALQVSCGAAGWGTPGELQGSWVGAVCNASCIAPVAVLSSRTACQTACAQRHPAPAHSLPPRVSNCRTAGTHPYHSPTPPLDLRQLQLPRDELPYELRGATPSRRPPTPIRGAPVAVVPLPPPQPPAIARRSPGLAGSSPFQTVESNVCVGETTDSPSTSITSITTATNLALPGTQQEEEQGGGGGGAAAASVPAASAGSRQVEEHVLAVMRGSTPSEGSSSAIEWVTAVKAALTITPAMSEAGEIPAEQLAAGVEAAAAAGVFVNADELRQALITGALFQNQIRWACVSTSDLADALLCRLWLCCLPAGSGRSTA